MLLPKGDFDQYLVELAAEINQRLAVLPSGRTFVMLTAMDTDSLACTLVLRKLNPDRQLYLIYPRLRNRIDNEKQSRRDALVQHYNMPVIKSVVDLPMKRSHTIVLCEFHVDAVYGAYSASIGSIDGTRGLSRSNDLGALLNMYIKTVADATSGYLIGTLNATPLLLGDFYRLAMDADFYPLTALFRSDVVDLIRMLPGMPGKLKDLLKTSPWQQKIRDIDQSLRSRPFGKMLPAQKTDSNVLLLPRQFHRLADPVIYMLDNGMKGDDIHCAMLGQMDRTQAERFARAILHIVGTPDALRDAIDLVCSLYSSGRRKLSLYQNALAQTGIRRAIAALDS